MYFFQHEIRDVGLVAQAVGKLSVRFLCRPSLLLETYSRNPLNMFSTAMRVFSALSSIVAVSQDRGEADSRFGKDERMEETN